ncbi:MAG: response regulator transcription factor [Actinomycetota bacterium]
MLATAPPGSRPLTPRQRQVLTLVSEGKTIREIALELDRSPFTIKGSMETIYERLGALDRVQAVSIALRSGQIN